MTSDHKIIEEIRKKLGSELLIAAHHYQSDEVIKHADLRGDSLELARKVAENRARHIVFCGVYFMAESAALLADEDQMVLMPDTDANCCMSQMTPHALLDRIIDKLQSRGGKYVPLAYVNTSAGVKSVCGKHGGAVCTSANAARMLAWAMKQGDGVLFLPDKNLAMNTAGTLGIPESEQLVIDIRKSGDQLDLEAVSKAKLLMWPGCCAIHARFNEKQIADIRREHPEAKVVVHPECSPGVVQASDAAGSTSFIIRYVEEAVPGTHIFVGTEWNLVNRLAEAHAGRGVKVEPILSSRCSPMAKSTEAKLADLLQRIDFGEDLSDERVGVPAPLVADARMALVRMLEVCS